MARHFSFRDYDWLLLLSAMALAVIGVAEIYSTTQHTLLAGQYQRQAEWVVLGLIVAVVIARIDYHHFVDHAALLYLVILVGLVVTLAVSRPVDGSRRWIAIGGLTFQVSEMAKLVVILCIGAYLAGRSVNPLRLKDLVALGLLAGVPAALVMLEPDLGTAMTFFPPVCAGIYLAGTRLRQWVIIALAAAMLVPIGWRHMRPYQRERLNAFMDPSANTQGTAYQVTQAKIAIGSGGLWGKGFGKGMQTRLGFVPVAHADFIFASFAEEQGFVGVLFVLLLYFVLLIRLLSVAQGAGDAVGAYFVVGLTSVLFFQVIVNVGMMIGFLPVTGIPLPLMSEGGSAILFTFAGLGLAMSVRARRFVN